MVTGVLSETGDTLDNPSKEGGSSPTNTLQIYVKECRFSDIRHIFEQYHYKGAHMGGGISVCYAAEQAGCIVGGMVVGKPRHQGKYPGLLELRRMALSESMPKNSESKFISIVVRLLQKKFPEVNGVLSYADGSVGHAGIIYKASNFVYQGETAASLHVMWNGIRYHPRSLTTNRPYAKRLQAAVKDGTAQLLRGKPKSIWTYRFRRTKCGTY